LHLHGGDPAYRHSRIEIPQQRAQSLARACGLTVRPYLQEESLREVPLCHGKVHHRLWILSHPAKFGRSGDAYHADLAPAAKGECLAERVAREELASELLIHDYGAFAAFGIHKAGFGIHEVAPDEQRHSESPEVTA